MDLAYLLDPNKQYQDRNGVNNVSGFIRVYYDGTDDSAITYCNFKGTMNKRDIPIDNNGRAVVIADSSKVYRVEVYDRAGSLMWTQHPISCGVSGGGGGGSFEQVQSDWNQSDSSAVNFIKNKPDLGNFLEKTGDGKDVTVTFNKASERTNIGTGEKLSVLFGKIKKWFSDLKAVAFSGSYNDLSNKPSIPTVDQSYSASSTNAQSGIAVAQAIINAKELPDIANKEDLYLRVNSSGTGILWAETPTPSFQSYKSTTTSVTIAAGNYTSTNVAATLTATVGAGKVFVGSMVLQLADFSGDGQTNYIELGYKAGTIGNDRYTFNRLAGDSTYVIPVSIDNKYESSSVSVGLIINGTVFASTTFTISLNGLIITV